MSVRYPSLVDRCAQAAANNWNRITQNGQIWTRRLDAQNPLLQLVMSCALIALHTLTSSAHQRLFLVGSALSTSCQLIMHLAQVDLDDNRLLQNSLNGAGSIAAIHIFLRKPGPLKELGGGFLMTAFLSVFAEDIANLGGMIFSKIFHTLPKRA